MATNEHQTHDLFHPTCERCHEEMFGSVEEVAKEACTICRSVGGVDPSMQLCGNCYDHYLNETLPNLDREAEDFMRDQEASKEAEAVSRAGLEQAFEDSLHEAGKVHTGATYGLAERALLNDLYGRLAN